METKTIGTLKMNRFTFTLHFAFIASILMAGCTAPPHLVHKSEPTQDEKLQQTINAWKGKHISKAVQKWGSPNEVSGDGTGWQIYTWHIPVQVFLPPGPHRISSRRLPKDLRGIAGTYSQGTYLQTEHTYEITFYARPNGIIYKTLTKRNHNPTSEFNWK